MSETITESSERRLWFDGPNYTADAIILNRNATHIALIQRQDTGDWAFPGGFIDAVDASPEVAAVREAREETGLIIDEPGHQVFQGIVDDPRNSEYSWIETTAFVFTADTERPIQGQDDAIDAAWCPLENLPPLYASHQEILLRAIDYKKSLTELYRPDKITSMIPVAGGHMQYEKYFVMKGDKLVFSKVHLDENFSDPHKAERSLLYLEKEAATMSHLRTKGYAAVPENSVMLDSALLMEAFDPEHDWHWRAPHDNVTRYIDDTLKAFKELEDTPFPSESFDIEPSYQSFKREGWQTLTSDARKILEERAELFMPRLAPDSQVTAEQLMSRLDELSQRAHVPHVPERFVPSHHDARQSNIAWHPEHGVKIVDWSWYGAGEPGSDATNFLIDMHKSGHDISSYTEALNADHCLTLIGFWLVHATWPIQKNDDSVRFQQFVSAVSALEVLDMLDLARG